jgi:hypothetical protein
VIAHYVALSLPKPRNGTRLKEDRAAHMNLEDFLKAHQYTVAALGVFGTFSAVVVALTSSVVAIRASRTRLSARASINVIHHSSLEGREQPKYLAVYIRNLGTMSVHIPLGFFHWKQPFRHQLYEVLPLDYSATDEWVAQRKYPVEIKARGSDIIFLSRIAMFQEQAPSILIGKSVFSLLCSHFVRAYVFTDEGRVFKVKLDSSLRKELARLRQSMR